MPAYRMIKVPANNAEALIEMQWSTLKNLQDEVGGYVERVIIGDPIMRIQFTKLVMLVNEDGAYTLPYNRRASFLYGEPIHNGRCYGNALLVGEVMTDEGMDFGEKDDTYSLEFFNELFRVRL